MIGFACHHGSAAPTSSPGALMPESCIQRTSSRRILAPARGSAKCTVPMATAEAPASRYSTTSSPLLTPPHPTMGRSGRARATSQTQRSAIGLSGIPSSRRRHRRAAAAGSRCRCRRPTPCWSARPSRRLRPRPLRRWRRCRRAFGDSLAPIGRSTDAAPRRRPAADRRRRGRTSLLPSRLGHERLTSMAATPHASSPAATTANPSGSWADGRSPALGRAASPSRGPDLRGPRLDAGVLDADAVEHSAAGRRHPRRRPALPGFRSDRLGDGRAVDGEVDGPGEVDDRADRPARGDQRGGERDGAQGGGELSVIGRWRGDVLAGS